MKLKTKLPRWLAIATVAIAAAFSSPALAEETEKSYGNWTHIHATNPMDDTASHTAFVVSTEGGRVAMLFIKCDEAGHPEHGRPYAGYTVLRTHLGSSGTSDVRYRIDGGTAIEQAWDFQGSTVINLNKDQVAVLAGALRTGNDFIIEARDADYQPYRTSFSLRGSSAAIGVVLRGCQE